MTVFLASFVFVSDKLSSSGSIGRHSKECLSVRVRLVFFSWGFEQLGERPQRWSVIAVISNQGHILSGWFITADVDLGHLSGLVFTRFLHDKSTGFPPPFSIDYLAEGFCESSDLRNEDLCTSFSEGYLFKLSETFLSESFFLNFIYFFINLHQFVIVCIYFILWVIIPIFYIYFVQVVSNMTTGSFLVDSCASLTKISHCESLSSYL